MDEGNVSDRHTMLLIGIFGLFKDLKSIPSPERYIQIEKCINIRKICKNLTTGMLQVMLANNLKSHLGK